MHQVPNSSRENSWWGKLLCLSAPLLGLMMSGCLSIEGGPPRLFSVAEEADVARVRVRGWEETYYNVPPNKAVRNEIIAARMREIDSFYYSFEASLIRERQEVGLVSTIISIGLSGAVPLVSAVATKNILGAASSGLQGATKAYSDEVLFQKTVQVLATQMRARRAIVASDIVTRMRTLDVATYPLSMANSDLDEYYAAGTIAGALIEVQKTVSAEAKIAEDAKASVIDVTFVSNASTTELSTCLKKAGARSALIALLKPASSATLYRLTIDAAAEAERKDLLARAKSAGVC